MRSNVHRDECAFQDRLVDLHTLVSVVQSESQVNCHSVSLLADQLYGRPAGWTGDNTLQCCPRDLASVSGNHKVCP